MASAAFNSLIKPRTPAGSAHARDVHIGRAGLLQSQTHELAASLDGGPVVELVGHGAPLRRPPAPSVQRPTSANAVPGGSATRKINPAARRTLAAAAFSSGDGDRGVPNAAAASSSSSTPRRRADGSRRRIADAAEIGRLGQADTSSTSARKAVAVSGGATGTARMTLATPWARRPSMAARRSRRWPGRRRPRSRSCPWDPVAGDPRNRASAALDLGQLARARLGRYSGLAPVRR